jgi:hypothetical protein
MGLLKIKGCGEGDRVTKNQVEGFLNNLLTSSNTRIVTPYRLGSVIGAI